MGEFIENAEEYLAAVEGYTLAVLALPRMLESVSDPDIVSQIVIGQLPPHAELDGTRPHDSLIYCVAGYLHYISKVAAGETSLAEQARQFVQDNGGEQRMNKATYTVFHMIRQKMEKKA